MHKQVDPFLDRLESNEGTIVTAWYEQNDSWKLYFGLVTTSLWDEREYTPTNGTRVLVNHVPLEILRSLIPKNGPESVSRTLSVTFDGDVDEVAYEFSSDVRLRYLTSQEMEPWGHMYPALCIEHWIESDDVTNIGEENEDALLDSLDDLGITLAQRDEYINTILVVFEDARCRVTFNENSEALVDQWHDDEVELTDEELLEVIETWGVSLHDIDPGAIELSLRREEYGDLLYETGVTLTNEAQVSRDEALAAARERERLSMVTVRNDDCVTRYQLPSIDAPGASDEILRVTKKGVLLDAMNYPVIREIGIDVTVEPTTTPASGQLEPPALYSESDYTVGRRRWDPHVGMESSDDRETWIVDDDDDFEEIMEIIIDELSGVVKLSEPYLVPDFLEEFIQSGADDLDLWVVLGHKESYLSGFRSDFENCVATANSLGKDVHILWVPHDPNSPLHDRFLLTADTGLMIGTSFNSLNANLTVVTEIGSNHSQKLEQNFDYWWTNSKFRRELDVEVIGST